MNPAYARVVYSLRPTSAEFDLDSTTGELRTLRPLDRELESVYLLYICAHDADRQALHQCINATVNIEDVNDNYPVVFDVSELFHAFSRTGEVHDPTTWRRLNPNTSLHIIC